MELPLCGEDGSIIYSYNCYWALPALSLSGPSPAELETIILLSHLRLGSLFVTSYGSQSYGVGIRTCFNTVTRAV
jgi:hypothetical protein